MVLGKRHRGRRSRGFVLAICCVVVAAAAGTAYAATQKVNRNATITAAYSIGSVNTLDPAFVGIDFQFFLEVLLRFCDGFLSRLRSG